MIGPASLLLRRPPPLPTTLADSAPPPARMVSTDTHSSFWNAWAAAAGSAPTTYVDEVEIGAVGRARGERAGESHAKNERRPREGRPLCLLPGKVPAVAG